MKKRIMIFMIMIFTLVQTAFSYGIQPMYFEADISNGQGYREISIINTNKLQKGRYKITIGPGRNPDKDISKYMEIYPKVLNVGPDSTGLVKLYAKIKEPLPKDEYSFMFKITPIVIPTLKKEASKISGGIETPIAFQLEMFGHYEEETQDEIDKKVLVKNLQVYEKKSAEGKKEIWVKGNVENNLYYGFVLSVKAESEGGTKIQTYEAGRITKNGGKLEFNFRLRNNFKSIKDVHTITILDLMSYKPMKEIMMKK